MDRVARVGEEFRQAARRRTWLKREDDRIQEEQKAFWHANVRAVRITMGQFSLRLSPITSISRIIYWSN